MASEENSQILVVPFGKYKGHDISKLLSDRFDWLNNQPWVKTNSPTIFNIVNLQQIPNYDNPTPEHNKLHNKFLNDLFVKGVCEYILKKHT